MPAAVDEVYALDTNDPSVAGLPELRRSSTTETKTEEGFTIFGNPAKVEALKAVALEFPDIWMDRGTTVDMPEEDYMPLQLKDGW